MSKRNFFKKLVAFVFGESGLSKNLAKAEKPVKQARVINNAKLGTLVERSPELHPDYFTNTQIIKNSSYQLSVSPDGESLETSLKLAEYIISKLDEWANKAAQEICNDMLDNYNENWRTGQKINRTAFIKKIALASLDVTGSNCITFMYDDGNLFAGHSITATYFELTQNLKDDLKQEGYISLFG